MQGVKNFTPLMISLYHKKPKIVSLPFTNLSKYEKVIYTTVLIPSLLFAQSRKEKKAAEHALVARQIDSIQLINDKAVIDVIVDMPGVDQKEIFTRLRN